MRYLILIYGSERDMPEMGDPSSPISAPWIEYTQWLTETGIYRGGERLSSTAAATTVRVQNGQRLVTDGPFAETKEALGGYYLIECPDLDTALEAAARCPGAAYGSIEVRPIPDIAPGVPDAVSGGTAG